jgi:putative ABC transport system permease protein
VVLSFARWQRLFGGDTGVLGRTLVLDDVPHTIVGVMPSRFGWWTSDGVWLPLGRAPGDPMVFPIVRLAPGAGPAVAEQQWDAAVRQLAAANPAGYPRGDLAGTLTNYLDITVASGTMQRSLQLLFVAVLLLLLIACANVANLQLARVSARAREVAVRLALGAGRRQIVRQLLAESLVLALIGGLAGLGCAYGITQLIVALMPESFVPNEARIVIDMRALGFCLAVSLATGLLFGMAPALQASRTGLTQVLNEEGRGAAGISGSRLRHGLVIVEVAIAVVLLAATTLTVRSLHALSKQELGFDPDGVLTMQVPLAVTRYTTAEARNQFAHRLLEGVRRLPTVQAAALGNGGLPFGGPASRFTIPGQPAAEDRRLQVLLAGEDHLRVMGVPLRQGRMFDERDVRAAERVAVINEAAAALWPAGVSPLGQRIALDVLAPPATSAVLATGTASKEVTVIGIAADARNAGLEAQVRPSALVPFTLLAPPQRTLAIRASGPVAPLVTGIRALVREMDPVQPLSEALPVHDVLHREMAQPRFLVALFGLFGGLGLALAAIGLYGVLANVVVRRTREIGIRMALGARRGDVLRLIAAAGGRLVALGLLVGLTLAVLVSSLLVERLGLFGIRPDDPLTYVTIAATLSLVALVACLVPAWHAARLPPTDAMR